MELKKNNNIKSSTIITSYLIKLKKKSIENENNL